jgi:hypothetical protein
LKKDPANLISYLKQIPLPTLEGYFKKSEVSAELLSALLTVLVLEAEHAWVGSFLLSLGKANNFDMTLMFAEDSEKKLIKDIVSKLPSEFSGKVQSMYTA